jgi:hypothetical protein
VITFVGTCAVKGRRIWHIQAGTSTTQRLHAELLKVPGLQEQEQELQEQEQELQEPKTGK